MRPRSGQRSHEDPVGGDDVADSHRFQQGRIGIELEGHAALSAVEAVFIPGRGAEETVSAARIIS
jgi:hypothetical protein